MSYAGNILLGNTIDVKFTTRNSSGVPTTLAGSPVISAYIGNSTTEITAGITLTVDFDSRTGLNNVRVVASGGNGFTTATDVTLVITTGTVNSVSVVGEVVGEFSIDNRVTDTTKWNGTAVSTPATAGIPDVNVKNIDNDAASASGTVTFPNATLASTNNITAAAGITLDYTNALPTTPAANTIGEALFLCDILGGRFGTAQAGSSTTITLDAGASATNDRYIGYMVFLYGGTGGGVRGTGQARTILAYNGTTKVATMDTAWGTNPDNTSKFMLLVHPPVNVDMWVGTQIGVPFSPGTPDVRAASLGANSITTNTIETDAISADSLKADAITEIATGVWALATRQLTGSQTFNLTGNITGNLTGTVGTVNAFAANSITAAAAATDFGTEMATAVWALGTRQLSSPQNFDNTGQWTGDIIGGVSGSVGSIATGGINNASFAADTGRKTVRSSTAQAGAATTITLDASASAVNDFYKNDLIYLTSGTGSGQGRFITAYNGTTKVATVSTWSTNPDNTTTFAILPWDSVTSSGGLDAAGVRAAVGLASANLDTQLAAVQADTDNIQTRLPAVLVSGRMDSSVGAMAANVMTASALATDAVTEISTGVDTQLSGTHGAGAWGGSGYVIRTGTLQSATSTSATLDAGASATSKFYNNTLLYITGGTGTGQSRFILSYGGISKIATVEEWSVTPDSSSTFAILPWDAMACTSAGLGPKAVTIHTEDDSAVDLGGVFVTVVDNGGKTAATGMTDGSGDFIASLLASTQYTINTYKGGYTSVPSVQTTSATNASQTLTTIVLTFIPLPVPPIDPDLCTLFGYIVDSGGNALEGVTVTAMPIPQNPVSGPVVTNSGSLISFNPADDVSDDSGYVEISVVRTDALSLPISYTITASNGQIARTHVKLNTSTKNINLL